MQWAPLHKRAVQNSFKYMCWVLNCQVHSEDFRQFSANGWARWWCSYILETLTWLWDHTVKNISECRGWVKRMSIWTWKDVILLLRSNVCLTHCLSSNGSFSRKLSEWWVGFLEGCSSQLISLMIDMLTIFLFHCLVCKMSEIHNDSQFLRSQIACFVQPTVR